MIISKSTNVSGFASVEKSASESLQMVQRVKFTCLSCVWKAPGCVSGGSSLPPFFMFYFCVFSLFKKEEPTVGKSGLTESFPPPPFSRNCIPMAQQGSVVFLVPLVGKISCSRIMLSNLSGLPLCWIHSSTLATIIGLLLLISEKVSKQETSSMVEDNQAK